MKKTIKDLNVIEKRVLVRVDFNVPIEDGTICDDARIRASLPTIQYLIEQRARIILISHLGRPAGFVVENLRLTPIAERLSQLLQVSVTRVNNCIGPEVQEAVRDLQPGQILLLENVRFHPGELVNDSHFAARLASTADVFVNDAFASLHRAHASTVGVTRFIPAVAGLLVESEILNLRKIQNQIRPPVVVLLGGIRLVDKAHFIGDHITHGSRILTGGVLANTFLKAQGFDVGQSRVENEVSVICKEILVDAGRHLDLPIDVVVVDELAPQAKQRVVHVNHIPSTGMIVDIGPQTVERYSAALQSASTIIWNGPAGATQFKEFSAGTYALARKIASLPNAISIAGGGDTLAVLDQAGLIEKFDYVSTGGAAFLEALENKPLPGIQALLDKDEDFSNVSLSGQMPGGGQFP